MDGEITSYTVMDSDDYNHISTSLNGDNNIESSSITTIPHDTDVVSDSQQVIYIERDTPWHIEQQDPLTPYRLLDEAADKKYPLTSKSIKEIIGIKPKGSSFIRLGFSFTKIGKDGVYSSWSVVRTLTQRLDTAQITNKITDLENQPQQQHTSSIIKDLDQLQTLSELVCVGRLSPYSIRF